MGQRFEIMHEVGRHGIHTSEVLEVTTNTITSLLEYQRSLHAQLWSETNLEYTMQAQEYGRFQLEAVKSLRLRSVSNDKRLDKEITLVRGSCRYGIGVALLTMTLSRLSTILRSPITPWLSRSLF